MAALLTTHQSWTDQIPILDTAGVVGFGDGLSDRTAPPQASSGHGTTGGGKKWASDEDWERHRATITRLYVVENRKLWQIMDYMAKHHAFFGTSVFPPSPFDEGPAD